MRKPKLLVVRAQHDSTAPQLSDTDVLQTLFSNSADSAVFDFWKRGFFDIAASSVLHPTPVQFVVTVDLATSRSRLCQHLHDKLVADGTDLSPYDGFVFLIWPGGQVMVPNPLTGTPGQPALVTIGFDAGCSSLADGRPFAQLPVTSSDHTFMCHEVGHVIGMEHTFGVLNNGVDWNGSGASSTVYGDPYDIMSSASFGSFNSSVASWQASPTFAGTPSSWPIAAAFNSMGCAAARANVHFFNEAEYPPQELSVMQQPAGTLVRRARIFRAQGGSGQPELLVVMPVGNVADRSRRCYVELRDNRDWDQGLDASGTDISRCGVVVHTTADSENGVRVWYRGTILIPSTVDLEVSPPDLPVTVTLEGVGPNSDYVDLRITARTPQGLMISHYESDEEVEVISEVIRETSCGSVRYGTYKLRHTSKLVPYVYGYGDPTSDGKVLREPILTWTVGSTTLNPATSPSQGVLSVQKLEGGTAPVRYQLATDGTLTFVVEPAHGAFTADIKCSVTEGDGSSLATEASQLTPLGEYTGVRRLDQALLKECIRRTMQRLRLRKRDLLIPPGPNPYRNKLVDRENLARIRLIVNSLSEQDRAVGAELKRMGALLYAREMV